MSNSFTSVIRSSNSVVNKTPTLQDQAVKKVWGSWLAFPNKNTEREEKSQVFENH